jgi:hypothetical protein
MPGGRHAKHSRILEATKEMFFPFTNGDEAYAIGGHAGYRINADSEYAYGEGYLPWDFESLVEAKVSFIALATLTPMTFRVVSDYCQAEVGYFQHNDLLNKSVNAVLNRLQEVDIADLLDPVPLEANDYVGIQISRQTGQNANAIFVGFRIRYNTPIYAHAP